MEENGRDWAHSHLDDGRNKEGSESVPDLRGGGGGQWERGEELRRGDAFHQGSQSPFTSYALALFSLKMRSES